MARSHFSRQRVPRATSAAMERNMAFGNQLAEVLLQRVSTRPGESYDVADGNSSVFARVLDDAH